MTINLRTALQSTVVLSILLILFGIGGMAVSASFMLSNDMRDIAGAGFGFVAGAIFIGSGLLGTILSLSALQANAGKSNGPDS